MTLEMLMSLINLCGACRCFVDLLTSGAGTCSGVSLWGCELLRRSVGLMAMGLIGCSSCADVSISNVVGVMSLPSLGEKSIYILECERLLLCCLCQFP